MLHLLKFNYSQNAINNLLIPHSSSNSELSNKITLSFQRNTFASWLQIQPNTKSCSQHRWKNNHNWILQIYPRLCRFSGLILSLAWDNSKFSKFQLLAQFMFFLFTSAKSFWRGIFIPAIVLLSSICCHWSSWWIPLATASILVLHIGFWQSPVLFLSQKFHPPVGWAEGI